MSRRSAVGCPSASKKTCIGRGCRGCRDCFSSKSDEVAISIVLTDGGRVAGNDPGIPGNPGSAQSAQVDPQRAQTGARAEGSRLQPELRVASDFVVFARTAGRANASTGASHWACRYADEVVEHVLSLHAAHVPTRQIARQCGIHRSTAQHWINGTRRRPPMRRSNCRRPVGFELPALIGLADLPISPTVDGPSGAVDQQGIERGLRPPARIA